MQRLLANVAASLSLLGCGADGPTDDEVRAALIATSTAIDKECVSFAVLDGDDLPAAEAYEYAPSLPILLKIDLLERVGDTYRLTKAGRESYDPDKHSFCYTSGYRVRNTMLEKSYWGSEIVEVRAVVGYDISFDRVPIETRAWITDPRLGSLLRHWTPHRLDTMRCTGFFYRRETGQPLRVRLLTPCINIRTNFPIRGGR